MVRNMDNKNEKDTDLKQSDIDLVKDGKREKPEAKTNAQLAAEAMDRLAKGEGNVHDIILLQRYLLKKPPSC